MGARERGRGELSLVGRGMWDKDRVGMEQSGAVCAWDGGSGVVRSSGSWWRSEVMGGLGCDVDGDQRPGLGVGGKAGPVPRMKDRAKATVPCGTDAMSPQEMELEPRGNGLE